MEDPFAPGGRLRLARRREDPFGPFLLRAAAREVGRLEVVPFGTAGRLTIGERSWRIDSYGRGRRLVAIDLAGGEAARWEQGALWATRLVLAPDHRLTVRRAVVRHRVRVLEAGGAVLLRAELRGRREETHGVAEVVDASLGVDPELLAALTLAALLLPGEAGSPPRTVRSPGWGNADFGGGGDLGGGGGDGGG